MDKTSTKNPRISSMHKLKFYAERCDDSIADFD